MQIYWTHTSAWVISRKFATFLQNTFSEEHLWRASGHFHYNNKHLFIKNIFLSIYWCKVILMEIKISIKISFFKCQNYVFISAHSSFYFCPFPHFLFIISTPIRRFSPWFPLFTPPIPHIPTLIPCILIIPLIPFPDFPFRLLKVAMQEQTFRKRRQ